MFGPQAVGLRHAEAVAMKQHLLLIGLLSISTFACFASEQAEESGAEVRTGSAETLKLQGVLSSATKSAAEGKLALAKAALVGGVDAFAKAGAAERVRDISDYRKVATAVCGAAATNLKCLLERELRLATVLAAYGDEKKVAAKPTPALKGYEVCKFGEFKAQYKDCINDANAALAAKLPALATRRIAQVKSVHFASSQLCFEMTGNSFEFCVADLDQDLASALSYIIAP
jgi:hypothetical protein